MDPDPALGPAAVQRCARGDYPTARRTIQAREGLPVGRRPPARLRLAGRALSSARRPRGHREARPCLRAVHEEGSAQSQV